MLQRYTMGLFIGLIISFSAWATPLELAKTPAFVSPNAISLELLPPPPAADSSEQKRDNVILMWEQNSRTVYDAQRAWGSVTLTPSYFNEALGARFEESKYPKLYSLMTMVLADSKLYTDAFKLHYKRTRPYDADPALKPMIPIEESFSYPSGHGTRGMTAALVLAELFPARRDALIQTGRTLGQDRVIGGVHYPSDIEAAVTLAEALAKSIVASDAFKAKVKAAQDEIQRISLAQNQNKN